MIRAKVKITWSPEKSSASNMESIPTRVKSGGVIRERRGEIKEYGALKAVRS
jgi:hypothetical protein